MELTTLADDGMMTPDVGAWGEEKYKLVSNYAQIFSTSMKRRWRRVYIDLFAGAGRVKLQGTGRIVAGSPLLALGVNDPFDKYIFCEQDPERLDVLKKRVALAAPGKDVSFVEGDMNVSAARILSEMPKYSPGAGVLSFCFVDPYSLDNCKFKIFRVLAQRFMDFMVLIPSFMDANRNWVTTYMRPDCTVVDDFLGDLQWRPKWAEAERKGERPGVFILGRFQEQMAEMGYPLKGLQDFVEVRSDCKNLPLYHLSFFSRHDHGNEFWMEARKYSSDQKQLF